jgi:hypothetical protein
MGPWPGVATNALIVLTAWAFETLALEKIILKTMVGNDASRRVAERAGFQAAPGPPGDEEWVRLELLRDVTSRRGRPDGA